MSLIVLLVTALLLGMRHALDPDHLVAVSTMVAEERRLWPAARLGLWWGAGHLLPIALLGLPILLLHLELPPTLESIVDVGVGLLLLILGARTLWRLHQERLRLRSHAHRGEVHRHFHSHAAGPGHSHPLPGLDRRGVITFLIGMLHGLAGSGAAALLALTAASSVTAGVGYLLAFGIGTVAGMFAMTLCIAAPALSAAARFARLHQALRLAAGAASIAVGLLMWTRLLPALLA